MIRALLDPSMDVLIAKRLTDKLGRDGARLAIAAVCRQFTNVELSALAARWAFKATPSAWFRVVGKLDGPRLGQDLDMREDHYRRGDERPCSRRHYGCAEHDKDGGGSDRRSHRGSAAMVQTEVRRLEGKAYLAERCRGVCLYPGGAGRHSVAQCSPCLALRTRALARRDPRGSLFKLRVLYTRRWIADAVGCDAKEASSDT